MDKYLKDGILQFDFEWLEDQEFEIDLEATFIGE